MAILPTPLTKPAKGKPGQFQNMEEWNAFTAFVSGTATKPIGFGHPVSRNGVAGDGTAIVKALATTEVFAGFTRENITTAGTTQTVYADGEKIGVADEGVIFGAPAGAVLSAQGVVWWNPADNTFRAATGTGFMLLPGCRYDQPAKIGEPAVIRFRVAPDSAAITAAS
jgi:hypothetical protein